MCIVCVEIMKGKLTQPEIERAYGEVQELHTEKELEDLYKFIEEKRPELLVSPEKEVDPT